MGGNQVQVWAREPEIVAHINTFSLNPRYLPDLELPDAVFAVSGLFGCTRKDLLVLATPSHTLRDMASRIKPMLSGNEVVITVSKGIEQKSFKTMSQVLVDILEGVISSDQIGVLSGLATPRRWLIKNQQRLLHHHILLRWLSIFRILV